MGAGFTPINGIILKNTKPSDGIKNTNMMARLALSVLAQCQVVLAE